MQSYDPFGYTDVCASPGPQNALLCIPLVLLFFLTLVIQNKPSLDDLHKFNGLFLE